MTISGETAINMTKIPQEAVVEGSVEEYVCETESSSQTAILWFVGNTSMDGKEVNTSSSVDYHGQIIKSTLTLTTNRAMNNVTVKCVLQNDTTKVEQHNLNVMCKYKTTESFTNTYFSSTTNKDLDMKWCYKISLGRNL